MTLATDGSPISESGDVDARIATARTAPLRSGIPSGFRAGLVARLGDMITIIGPRGDARPFPGTGRTVAEALGSDWEKLGGDMRRAVAKVVPVGEL